MRKILLATAALLALTAAARADVFLDTTGQGGTGINVVSDGLDPTNNHLLLGHLNGHNDQIVRFLDMSNTSGFTGASSGNDIKIIDTSNLDITIFDNTNKVELGTTRDIFSIKGSGSVFFTVQAVKADGTAETFAFTGLAGNVAGLGGGGFDISKGQAGFDFNTGSSGEVITDIDLYTSVGSSITDFEHYRLDVAAIPAVAAVPEASTWMMMIAGFFGIGGLAMIKRRREGHAFRMV
jgi:hypothetical protein